MRDMADRITIVSAERVRDELVKLICAPYPRLGLTLLVDTGLADHVLPELPALKLERDEHHRHKDVYEHTLTVLEQAIDLEDAAAGGGPDFVSRFAALMHDVGKPKTRRFLDDGTVTFHHHDVVGAKLTRKRMQALRFSGDEIDAVSQLVELHLRFHGYGSGEWTDSAVRRYVRDAGDQLDRLHVLTRADCTTRNRRKAERLRRTYDDLEARIAAAVGGGGAGLDPAGPRRQPDHGDPRHPPGPRGGRGLPVPARAAARQRPDDRGGRARRAAGLVGPAVARALTRRKLCDGSAESALSRRYSSPRMKASTRSRPSSSGSCTGGDFMRYDDAVMIGPPMPRSLAILAARIASMMMPAELGESQTSSLYSRFSGTSPNARPSSRT